MALMGVREYARHRDISHVAVLGAIRTGRLSTSVTRNEKGKPMIDSEKADKEWQPGIRELFKDAERSLELDENGEKKAHVKKFANARADREGYKAKIARLEYREAAGKLVNAEVVKREWVAIGSRIRTKLLGVPTKLKQKTPDLSDEQFQALEGIIREALEGLADGD
jgi:phage terminase Nu1 subunit (DNA packaging protein)